MRKFIKKMKKFFVHLEDQENGTLNFNFLLLDSGNVAFSHLVSAINSIKKSLGSVKITVLTTPQRIELMGEFFQGLDIIVAGRWYIVRKFRIAFELLLLSLKKFDFIGLLSTDFIPSIISLLIFRKRLYLYNQQHQWILIRRRTLDEYLIFIPKFIINLFVFIYLLLFYFLMIFKRMFNSLWLFFTPMDTEK